MDMVRPGTPEEILQRSVGGGVSIFRDLVLYLAQGVPVPGAAATAATAATAAAAAADALGGGRGGRRGCE